MKTSEMRAKSLKELQQNLVAACRALYELRMKRSGGDFKPTHLFKQVRVEIARLKTVIAEKAREQ